MIVQYYLSIYSVNFFCLPSFQNFKIRVVNQQSSQVTDSKMLNVQKLDQTIFPLQIKLKGLDNIMVKLKMLNMQKGHNQQVLGQGVANIGKNTLDASIRVPIYDNKVGIEEIAICSIDFLVSGYKLDKKQTLQKNTDKKDKKRNGQQEGVYSQMSYTVQTDKQLQIDDVGQKQEESKSSYKYSQETSFKKKSLKNIPNNKGNLNKYNFIQEPVSASRKGSRQSEGIQEQSSVSSIKQVLHNNAYLSQQKRKYPTFAASRGISKTRQKGKISQQSKISSFYIKKQLDESLSPQKIRQKMQQSENLISKLKKYLSNHQKQENILQQNKKTDEHNRQTQQLRQIKHKRRNRPVKIQQMHSYNTKNTFVKYYYKLDQKPVKIIRNIKIDKLFKNYQDYQFSGEILDIQKFIVMFNTQQKCAVFDAKEYRSFCALNRIQPQSVEIKVPSQCQSFKIIVFLKKYGEFSSIIGSQEGQGMTTKLQPSQIGRNHDPLREQFHFSFDINSQQVALKPAVSVLPRYQSQQISYRESQQVVDSSDVKTRIQSLSLQPWNYGYSYLNRQRQKGNNQQFKKQDELKQVLQEELPKKIQKYENLQQLNSNQKQEQKKIKKQKQKQIKSQVQIVIKGKKSQSSASRKSKSLNQLPQIQQAKKDKNIANKQKTKMKRPQPIKSVPLKSIYISQYEQSNNQFPKQQHKSSNPSVMDAKQENMRQIREINRLRNGNRNNYRFKEIKHQKRNKRGSEEGNLKEMWEQLLLNKKVQEDSLSMQKVQKKKFNYLRKNHKNRDNSSSYVSSLPNSQDEQSKTKTANANLYGCISGTSQVVKVKEGWQGHSKRANQYPLRKINLQVNNIAISQPQDDIDQQIDEQIGKFVKFCIKGGVTYFTQIIFNGQCNSILWKLSGCIFRDLEGANKLEVQIYSTLNNRINLIGKTSIRMSKLFFLRNNHIYNGNISSSSGVTLCQFTIGFNVEQIRPFQIIREQDEQTVTLSRHNNATYQQKSSRPTYFKKRQTNTVVFKQSAEKDRSDKKRYESLDKKCSQSDLNETLKKKKGGRDEQKISNIGIKNVEVFDQ